VTPALRNLPPRAGRRRPGAGFTLAEVMISAALACFILAGVMSTFLFLGRSEANTQNYNDLEAQTRKTLEIFAEDTRQASAIAWTSRVNLTLTVNNLPVSYYYDPTTATFYRQVAGGTATALVTNVTSFSFQAYAVTGTALALADGNDLAAAGRSTKQLQFSLVAARTTHAAPTATNAALSARFILRNKKVTT
jgi:Tfp pilus assembly protein PilW